MNLQLLAEEASTGAEAGAMAVDQPATGTTEQAVDQPATGEGQKSFDELIKTTYKSDFDKAVKGILNKRLKGAKSNENRVKTIQPVMEMFARKYGIDARELNDETFNAITSRIMEDNSFYEEEALNMGMDVETLKNLRKTERENEELKRFRQEVEQNQENQRRFMAINQEAEALRATYPNFDLDAEMENPEFQRLAWNAGVPLKTAYEVIHHDEILPTAMQYTAQRTAEQISNSIQSGMRRPQEGGMSNRSASVLEGKSPRNWSKEELKSIRERVRNGERIEL